MSAHKFKAGDKVRRVGPANGLIMRTGQVFEVAGASADGNLTLLKLVGLEQYGFGWYAYKFELVKPAVYYYRNVCSTPGHDHGPFPTEEAAIQSIQTSAGTDVEYEVVEVVVKARVKISRSVEVTR